MTTARAFAARPTALGQAGVVAAAAAAGGVVAVAGGRGLLGFALVVSLGLVGAAIVWPETATLAVLFMLWINVPGVATTVHGLPAAIGALVILPLLIPLAYQILRREPVVVTPVAVLVGVFFIVMVLSTIFSTDVSTALSNVQTYAFEGVLLYFLVTNAVRTPQTLRRCTWVLLAGGACLGALTLLQTVTHNYYRNFGGFAQINQDFFYGLSLEHRVGGPVGDPNYYAQLMLVLVPIGLLAAFNERSRAVRVAAFTATGLVMAAIVLTSSRGGALAFVVLIVLMAMLRYLRVRHLVIVAAAVAIVIATVPSYRNRITSVKQVSAANAQTGAQTQDQSIQGRKTEMIAAGLAFADHPVLGVGPGVFPSYYQSYGQKVGGELHTTIKYGPDAGQLPKRESHDLFLSVAADLGVPGLLVFLACIAVTLRALVRARRRWLRSSREMADAATAYILAIIVYVLSGLFLALAFERYFWLLLALAGAVAWMDVRGDREDARTAPPAERAPRTRVRRPVPAPPARAARVRATP